MTITNEVLNERLSNTSIRLEKVEVMISSLPDKLDGKFVSHDVYDLKMKEFDIRIKELDLKIIKFSKNKTLQMWILGTGSATAASLLTLLIQEALKR